MHKQVQELERALERSLDWPPHYDARVGSRLSVLAFWFIARGFRVAAMDYDATSGQYYLKLEHECMTALIELAGERPKERENHGE